jgi:hypothetical protein
MTHDQIAWMFAALGAIDVASFARTSGSHIGLRRMARLSAALAAIALAGVSSAFAAAVMGAHLAASHPRLAAVRPRSALLLILLVPAAFGVLAFPPPLDVDPRAAPFGQGLALTGLVALAVLLGAHRTHGRVRCLAGIAGAGTLAALLNGELVAALALAAPAWAILGGLAGRARIWRVANARTVAAGAVAIPAAISAAQAGPWTQPRNEGLAILRAGVDSGATGEPVYSAYAEQGLTDAVSLVTFAVQEAAQGRTKAGGGAGLRARLWTNENWVVSTELSAGLEPFVVQPGLQALDQRIEWEAKLGAGWGGEWDLRPAYAAMEVSYVSRKSGTDEVIAIALSGGLDLDRDWQVNAHLRAEASPDGLQETLAQASLVWRLDDAMAFEIGVQAKDRANADVETGAFAGVWIKF